MKTTAATQQKQVQQADFEGSLAGTKVDFPVKLHFLLVDVEQRGECDIVSWLPQGHAFKVHDKVKFVNQIIPRYFHSTKFKSFQRSLNLWGFESIRSGPDKGATFHRLFVRDQLKLCRLMIRKGSAKAASTGGPSSPSHRAASPPAAHPPPQPATTETVETAEERRINILREASRAVAAGAGSPSLSLPLSAQCTTSAEQNNKLNGGGDVPRPANSAAAAAAATHVSTPLSLPPTTTPMKENDNGRNLLLSLLQPRAVDGSFPRLAEIPSMAGASQLPSMPTATTTTSQGTANSLATQQQQQQQILLALLQLEAARKERAAVEQLNNLCLVNTFLQQSQASQTPPQPTLTASSSINGSNNNGSAAAVALLSLLLPGVAGMNTATST